MFSFKVSAFAVVFRQDFPSQDYINFSYIFLPVHFWFLILHLNLNPFGIDFLILEWENLTFYNFFQLVFCLF